jgi:hypothetical protein
MKKIDPILFIVFFNIISSIILYLNKYNIVRIDEIWIRFILLVLFIFNLLLFYFIVKK